MDLHKKCHKKCSTTVAVQYLFVITSAIYRLNSNLNPAAMAAVTACFVAVAIGFPPSQVASIFVVVFFAVTTVPTTATAPINLFCLPEKKKIIIVNLSSEFAELMYVCNMYICVCIYDICNEEVISPNRSKKEITDGANILFILVAFSRSLHFIFTILLIGDRSKFCEFQNENSWQNIHSSHSSKLKFSFTSESEGLFERTKFVFVRWEFHLSFQSHASVDSINFHYIPTKNNKFFND